MYFIADPKLTERLLGATKPDIRTDVYIVGPASVGLKLRDGGKQGLELKLRMDRKARGAEKWKKFSVEGNMTEDKFDAKKCVQGLRAILQEVNHDGLKQVIATIESGKIVFFHVHKTVHKKSISGLVVEQSRLAISIPKIRNTALEFYTINVEKGNPSDMYTYIETNLANEVKTSVKFVTGEDFGAAAMGYPGFVEWARRDERLRARRSTSRF